MPAIWAGVGGAALSGLGGMFGGNKAAKAQKGHYKWLQKQLLKTKGENASLFGQALGENRLGLLGLLRSQRNQERMFGTLGAGAAEEIGRSAQSQLGDISQQAAQGGLNTRFLGARTGVMQNQALALNQLKSQLAGIGIGMQGQHGQELAAQHGQIGNVFQNQAQSNASLFGAGGALANQAAPQGYSPGGDFLSGLGQGVSFFAGLHAMNQQKQGGPGGYAAAGLGGNTNYSGWLY